MLLNRFSAYLRFFCASFFALISLFLTSTASYADNPQSSDIHIRALASSCAACHGTKGNSVSITPVLAGLDATYISTQLRAFKSKKRESTVMHHHASALTDQEINLLATYFSQQKRITPPSLQSQALEERP